MSRDSDRSIYGGRSSGGYYSGPSERDTIKKFKKAHRKQKKTAQQQRQDEVKRVAAEKTGQDTYAREARNRRLQSTQQGRADTQSFINQEQTGLTPKQRSAMQYGAESDIDREHQAAQQTLLGEQGRRGIMGRGGVGYAQQRDLQRMAQEARGGVTRDLDKLNADMALKKQAAIYSGGAAEASQADLDRQIFQDEARYNQERKDMNNVLTKKKNKNFMKI
jgi:hypothetical protein